MAAVSGRYVTGGVTHTFTLHLTAGTSSTGQGGSFTITVDGTYTYTGTTPQIVKVSCPTFSQTPYQRFSEDGYSQWRSGAITPSEIERQFRSPRASAL